MKRLLSDKELAAELYRRRCITFGDFTLSAGGKSPYYIDLRIIPSYPDLYDAVTDLYASTVRKLEADRIAGIATAGIPIAALTAHKLAKPFLYVRKEAKAHGTQRLIEGVLNRGDVVVVVDDVITTGSNIVRAVRAIRELEACVSKAVVLIDREQGGADALRREGVELISIVRASRLVGELRLQRLIDESTYRKVLDYISSGRTRAF